ncbi:hypothetical protein SNOG_06810 [Parastagonospora nodorum SN15]|uniref:BHLH domain-containing protein n=1 Tax=Phaeosphaeria nodorum (strain SN15 / ATCC MYA-4574 / FGSC 10173) TaxID=321614 RepID=Q0UN54_PHANO|nr:hypothetical protein SNOG_06810 [Parastagonospora nodorum SN15]EAT85461.2 hypothetical protein SNOG_06810 [Parastagonospora nodorum SN15]
MPKPSFPPTPAASLDITGDSSANAPRLENGFTLPPAALGGGRGSVASSSGPSENASDSSYRPISPSSPVASSKPSHARKRSSTTAQQGSVVTKDDYSLPPPPTRSRKIIQMKPKDQEPAKPAQSQNTKSQAPASTTSGTKRKQASNTNAAGRKIARKTAHSLIERRRRSKMNEEFGVLKDMIPACRGQEMHKLAILQASIEYMRYLEQCISDLKSAHSRRDSPSSVVSVPPPLRRIQDDDEADEDDDEDEEMEDATSPTHVASAVQKSVYTFVNPSPSPVIYPSDRTPFSLTSPALKPQADREDHEATEALLMLNTDRRSWSGARGMSVKDMLSG